MITRRFLFGPGAALALTLLAGCNRGAQTVQPPTPPLNAAPQNTTRNGDTTASQTPIRDAVEAFLTQHTDGTLLPKAVRLLSVNLKDGVVTLDFSPEFQALANMGDSTEAEAQKELRKVLAKFPEVQKMRVTVEGQHFDSQMTDWYEPFPVRDEETDDVSQKPNASEGSQ